MARELIAKEVDGHLYQFEQFSTTDALKVMAKLTKIFGESITIALGSFFKKKPEPGKLGLDGLPEPVKPLLEQDVDENALEKAVKVLLDHLDETEVVALVKKLSSEKVLCDGSSITFDLHYQGETLHLFKVIAASLEAQFGNFIGAITTKSPVAGAAVRAAGIAVR